MENHSTTSHHDNVRLTAFVHGTVQGVGFRWWTLSQAKELALTGSAKNLTDGRVCVVAEGPKHACEELLARLHHGPASARVTTVIDLWQTPRGITGFEIG
ncbi:MAG: acylphosphatase [Corynebacterium sp.]|uniref:acylphosphatase n=1 Tax=Corynebacterium sp. TaxID=1720 RepID=UPI0026DC08FA|nr:acylphosphatase [Corynebacterium sp.]MDO4762084.1 acylphosphatase [Corynebacterium sp.]